MAKRNIEELHKIYTKDNKRNYTIEALRTLYVVSNDTAVKFANRHNIELPRIERLIEDGKWDDLRASNADNALNTMQSLVRDHLEDALEIEIELQVLQNLQVKAQIKELAKYYETHGDLFARNANTGEIIKDGTGQPILLTMPTGTYDISKRKGSIELMQGIKKLLAEANKEEKLKQLEYSQPVQAIEGSVVDETPAKYRNLFDPEEET